MTEQEGFTFRDARSGAVTAGFAFALAIEGAVLHLWLAPRHPGWAWTSTTLSVAALAWLVLDYRAVGDGAVKITEQSFELRLGRRMRLHVPRDALAGATAATWRDVPDTPDPKFLNATAPAEPNVLLTFAAPVPVRLAGGLFSRSVLRLGLSLDEPARFLAALDRAPGRSHGVQERG